MPLLLGADWAMLGGSTTRNAVRSDSKPPLSWQVEGGYLTVDSEQVGDVFSEDRGVRWSAQLGSAVIAQAEPEKQVGYWPQWRGPKRDNLSTETDLLDKWPEGGPPLRWRVTGIGEGIASIAIAGGQIYTLGYIGEGEYLTALDEKNGTRVWAKRIGDAMEESNFMRWIAQRTPTVDENRLYALTGRGKLLCLSVVDGDVIWQKDYLDDFGAEEHSWGLCDYPLVDKERLICTPGGNDATMVALDKSSGDVIWSSKLQARPDWSASIMTEACGVRQYVTFVRRQLVGIAAADGHLLWTYDEKLDSFNPCTPIVHGDNLVVSNGRRGSIIRLKLEATEDGVEANRVYYKDYGVDLWSDALVLLNGHIYNLGRRAGPQCVKYETGELVWRRSLNNFARKGGWTCADGHLYQLHSSGRVTLIEATPRGYVEHGMFMISGYRPALGATMPVVAGGRLYVRNDDQLFCFDIRDDSINAAIEEPWQIVLEPPSPPATRDRNPRTIRSVFSPTPHDVVNAMLRLAEVKETDVVCDLGSGDGRIVIAAAKQFGCKATGYEIDEELVKLSRERAAKAGVADLVTIERADIFDVDLRQADVVAVFLLPKQLERLIPQLDKLKAGARIASHQFKIPGIELDRTIKMRSTESGDDHAIHLWTVPLKKSK